MNNTAKNIIYELDEDCITDMPDNVTTDALEENVITDISKKVTESSGPGKNDHPDENSTDQTDPEKTQETAETEIDLEKMIAKLPRNFPDANHILKSEILPLIIDMDFGMRDFYIDQIKRKLSVSKQTIKETIKACVQEAANQELNGNDDQETEMEEIDPEIQNRADKIARDPLLLKYQIDTINDLGIKNERQVIGLYLLTIQSRLNPIDHEGIYTLALKNTGLKGSGKSASLLTTLKIFPKNTYEYLNGGSAKSLYYLEEGVKNKAIIIGEAFSFQKNNPNDTEFSYVLRCLLSEAFASYQYTSTRDGKKVTVKNSVFGPISLITTSIYDDLEEQLDDRAYTVHPNVTPEQTKDIIKIEGKKACGKTESVDDNEIKALQVFNGSLESLKVNIPYSNDISDFVVKNGDLPVSARRAFRRVITSIKTICLIHQKQRLKDGQGRVIAEISDYALAYQLIEGPFRESLGEGKYTDRRIQLIDRLGPITPRDFAKIESVTGAAITGWSKNWIERGVLVWVDETGTAIKAKYLEKLKHSGKAYLKVVGVNRLPTPFELSGDVRWDVGGDLYQMYDLGLEEDFRIRELRDISEDGINLNTSCDMEMLDNSEDEGDFDGGVKVFGSKSQKSEKNIFEKTERDPDFDEIEADKLYAEFNGMILPVGKKFENSLPVNNVAKLPEGILTF